MSNEQIDSTKTSNYDQSPRLVYDNARMKLNFSGDLLKQDKIAYSHGPIVNIYVVYRLAPRTNNSDVTLENCLFGAVKLTKHADINKYKYSGYGIGFDSKGSFSDPSGRFCKNVIIFEADMSSSSHANNKTRSIVVLDKDFIQGIGGTTIYAEKVYYFSVNNFTVANKIVFLSLS